MHAMLGRSEAVEAQGAIRGGRVCELELAGGNFSDATHHTPVPGYPQELVFHTTARAGPGPVPAFGSAHANFIYKVCNGQARAASNLPARKCKATLGPLHTPRGWDQAIAPLDHFRSATRVTRFVHHHSMLIPCLLHRHTWLSALEIRRSLVRDTGLAQGLSPVLGTRPAACCDCRARGAGYAAGTMAVVCLGKSSQPSICCRVRMKIRWPTGSTPNRSR